MGKTGRLDRSFGSPISKAGLVLDEQIYTDGNPASRFVDLSGNGNHGTHTAITWVRNEKGLWVRSFNGTSSYVSLGTGLNLLNNFTIMGWIQRTDTASANLCIFSNYDGVGTKGYLFLIWGTADANLNKLGLFSGGSWKYSNTTINDTLPHFVAVSLDSSNNYTFYHNGVADGTGATLICVSSPTQATLIGKQGTSTNYFKGQESKFRMCSPVATALQIRATFESQRGWFGV